MEENIELSLRRKTQYEQYLRLEEKIKRLGFERKRGYRIEPALGGADKHLR